MLAAIPATAVPSTMDGAGVLFEDRDPIHVATLMDEIVSNAALQDRIVDGQLPRIVDADVWWRIRGPQVGAGAYSATLVNCLLVDNHTVFGTVSSDHRVAGYGRDRPRPAATIPVARAKVRGRIGDLSQT